jgi:hypothetical protein
VFIADKVSFIAQLSLFLSLGGYLVFFITSLVMHQHTQPGSYLTESGLGNSGWNPGAAWLLAISNAMYAYGGTDGGRFPLGSENTFIFLRNDIDVTFTNSNPYLRRNAKARQESTSSNDGDHGHWSCYLIIFVHYLDGIYGRSRRSSHVDSTQS